MAQAPACAAARPTMIGILGRFRHMLEDLGGVMGVTDPASDEVVARSGAPGPEPAGMGACRSASAIVREAMEAHRAKVEEELRELQARG